MLRIDDLRQQRSGRAYVSPRRLCLTADGEIVDCADPRAATLLVGEGCELPWDVAERYGLVAGGDDAPPSGENQPRVRSKRVRDDRIEDKGG